MGRFTVRLPDTLHNDLITKATDEGVSLNQYVVFALTKQLTTAATLTPSSTYTVQAVTAQAIQEQKAEYTTLMDGLGTPDREAAREYLSQREVVEPESEKAAALIKRVQEKIAASSNDK